MMTIGLEALSSERVKKYIYNVEKAIESIDLRKLQSLYPNLNFTALIDSVQRYIGDARYYLSIGDYETALAIASYTEGLLDSLRYLGLVDIQWPTGYIRNKKVFVGGTFDIIHPGHIALLEFASKLGDLYVVVARDTNVVKIKGRKPVLDESSRLRIVSSIRYVYKAILGDEKDIFKSLVEVKPDIIVLGPDQPFNEEQLAEEAEKRLEYRPEIIRYTVKHEFSSGLRGSRDIIRDICNSNICKNIH